MDELINKQLAMLWWLSFFGVLGMCVGSFINVLIYRLPLGQSLTKPRNSACPRCLSHIRWFDNIPVISFLLLGGRCRQCRLPISIKYPIVELMVGIIFLTLIDALVVQELRIGLYQSRFLSDRVLSDWPILLSHLSLFACLFAMSAIDLEHYWVDVRFTNAVTIVGFVTHTIWTPSYSISRWIRPNDTTMLICIAALVGVVATWLVLRFIPWDDEVYDFGHDHDHDHESELDDDEPVVMGKGIVPPSRWPVWFGALFIGLMVVVPVAQLSWPEPWVGPWRDLLPIALILILVIACSVRHRESDTEIAEAIEEERFSARRMAIEEFVMLMPAIIAGGVVLWFVMSGHFPGDTLSHVVHAEVKMPSTVMMRHWQPIYGFGTAVSGYIIAAVIGWVVRIIFTLIFGKEAMGSGDIHLMAATGCVAGWPVVLVGFFLACFLAIFGWLAVLPWKRSRAIPLGPWLAMAFLIVVVYYEALVATGPVANVIETAQYLLTR